MKNSALSFRKTACSLPADQILPCLDLWVTDLDYVGRSPCTVNLRRVIIGNLAWFIRDYRGYPACGTKELKEFFTYLRHGHEKEGGRWAGKPIAREHKQVEDPKEAKKARPHGNPHALKPTRPSTLQTYHRHLFAFFEYLVREEILPESPMRAILPPTVQCDQIKPFTPEEVDRLLTAARTHSRHPRRDEVILLVLLDTGLRATELCSMRRRDLDLEGRRCSVLGKGNKRRTVPFGGRVRKALFNYLRIQPTEPGSPLFYSDRSLEPMTRSGLLQMIRRTGAAANIDEKTRCSPYTFRHTFAIEFLRAGGNLFTLQMLLGHTSLAMTNRYVALAQADIEAQHRMFSPADRLRRSAQKASSDDR